MNYDYIHGIKIYTPSSRKQLIEFAFKEKKSLIAINAEKIVKTNNELKLFINNNIGYPDGIGAVWALNKSGSNNVAKIPGCELWLDILKMYEGKGKVYLIGGSDQVIKETVCKIYQDFPNVDIVGYRNGYFKSANEEVDLINEVWHAKPDIVFVAMGTPKQEKLIERLAAKHKALYQGLGGSYDVYTGRVKRAPNWMIKLRVEFLYRLLKEPTRAKRYFSLFKFIRLLFTNKLTSK
ncbi:WecB/TagA/CpsF family glycosyltransferase [Vibrio sp. F12]|uniref:WecB/TagA/CpsF family glycosyltransferase n=1 Tax=Vibrio sp. F12 TaxID=2070776 RepID=UPI0010BD3666|nr:WecB/TagA/CpsF family glycosyltransferase [Vibrio sp. F12]TKE90500.1 WecB/TagA/CpsF family glycosyltransferase [Vibrio sp. F12]